MANIDLNITLVQHCPLVHRDAKEAVVGDSYGQPSDACKLFNRTPNSTQVQDESTYSDYFMETIIYEGRGQVFDPDGTQSKDDRDRDHGVENIGGHDNQEATNDQGEPWHEYMYCEDENNGVDIAEEPLFIDELTLKYNAQKRRENIQLVAYTKDEDTIDLRRVEGMRAF
ncbi:putative MO25-like protein [Hordeum vulgare]|nr:putative MO25-like protein [Hordeum vulgare]